MSWFSQCASGCSSQSAENIQNNIQDTNAVKIPLDVSRLCCVPLVLMATIITVSLRLTGTEATPPFLRLMTSETTPPLLSLALFTRPDKHRCYTSLTLTDTDYAFFPGADMHKAHASFTGTKGHLGHASFTGMNGTCRLISSHYL